MTSYIVKYATANVAQTSTAPVPTPYRTKLMIQNQLSTDLYVVGLGSSGGARAKLGEFKIPAGQTYSYTKDDDIPEGSLDFYSTGTGNIFISES